MITTDSPADARVETAARASIATRLLGADHSVSAVQYDFLRPNRLPAVQLRAIRQLHENFCRSLGSSFSAYLRSFVMVSLTRFEQLSYAEFIESLPSPAVIAAVNLRPYEGMGVLEIDPGAYFPILELLLGGNAKEPARILDREITDIEQRLIEMLLRVLTKDLRDAWKAVAPIDFSLQGIEKEPQFLQVLPPSEAVIVIGMEIRVGAHGGLLNIAIPSLMVKMMRQKFDQQWTLRQGESATAEQEKMMQLLEPAEVEIEICLEGAKLAFRDFLRIREGDLLMLDLPVNQSIQCLVNGNRQFSGHIANHNGKRVFVIDHSVAV